MADVPVLACTAGELAGKRIPVPEGGLGIGRSPENAVVIHDEGVSRYHGRLLFENGSLWLQDAGSRNGVFVNGVRVTGHKALKVGDSITIAQHTFELRWQDDDVVTPGPRSNAESGATAAANGAAGRARPTNPREKRTTPPPDATTEPARRRWFWPFS
jgi:pSer/pThr/pTyr-binding forkhead associated (FHA) protein